MTYVIPVSLEKIKGWYPYYVKYDDTYDHYGGGFAIAGMTSDQKRWCGKHIESDDWAWFFCENPYGSVIGFNNAEDAMAFKLRWF